jgi:regulator of sirC expression with transglutaminase-like and TPR domain
MKDELKKLTDQTASKRSGPSEKGGEVRALISLLSDGDERIVSMVWENLLKLGETSLPYLQEASEHEDPRLRLRARHVAAEIRAELLEVRFNSLASCGDRAFDLEEALCTVAMIEYPLLETKTVSAQLDELATEIAAQIPDTLPVRKRIELLNQILFREMGFKGNTRDYYEPDNSFIHKVIDRRHGIPISLSALLILLGRRLDLPLHGVGLPKHFVVKYEDDQDELFIDPFNGGRIFNRKECMQMLTSDGYYFRESFAVEYLTVSSSRDMVIRMLRNLVLIYSKLKDKSRVKRLSRYVEILRTRERTG